LNFSLAVALSNLDVSQGRDVAEETAMRNRSIKKLVREGEFVAEVDVELAEAEGGWAPYLSLADAYKLDEVRAALRAQDLARAAELADRVYRLTPVQV
jgi:Asp-tRNA(Asn)/Glu-tRNA(Gln) amidotransferase A subunit family amidase